jgi:hypothetical protein
MAVAFPLRPLRLGENRRLNEKAYFSPRRKGAKAPPFISQRPSGGKALISEPFPPEGGTTNIE